MNKYKCFISFIGFLFAVSCIRTSTDETLYLATENLVFRDKTISVGMNVNDLFDPSEYISDGFPGGFHYLFEDEVFYLTCDYKGKIYGITQVLIGAPRGTEPVDFRYKYIETPYFTLSPEMLLNDVIEILEEKSLDYEVRDRGVVHNLKVKVTLDETIYINFSGKHNGKITSIELWTPSEN